MDKNPHLPGSAEEFIKANMGLAQSIAWKFYRTSKDKDIQDLTGIAYYGLSKAYQGFDPTNYTGVDGGPIKFSTYAGRTISGYIMTYLRQVDHPVHLGRRGIDLIYKINSSELIGNETIQEIANKVGISFEDANEAVMASIAVNTDSLDREIISDDGGITLADVIGEKAEGNEDQETIRDFMSQLSPRDHEICRLRVVEEMSQREASKVMGFTQSYFSRLEKKLMEKAHIYGEREREIINREGGIADMANDNTRKMREEITKSEQFNIIGSAVTIAEKYGVAVPTAYAWKRQLKEKEMEVSVIKEDAVKLETSSFPIKDISQIRGITNTSVEGREGMSEQFDNKGASILTDTHNEGLTEGLCEPEPPWTPEYAREPNWTPQQTKPAFDQIQRKWQNIETELVLIRMLYKERTETDFWGRFEMVTKGMR